MSAKVGPESRAHGALLGLAMGDALGMPTQYQPRALIAARYGILDWFQPGPDDNFISRGMAAGRVTDDTDQAVLLGEMLVEGGGRIDPERFAQALLAWEARMIAAGSLDLLGPSTRQALKLVAEGASTDLTGRFGATNGAAMRVAPVGIAFPTAPLSDLVDAVFQTGHVTHNTTIAIAGASAVAAAVSAGIEGATLHEALALAVEAARLGAERGFYFAGGEVAARTEWALGLVRGRSEEDALDLIYRLVGTGVATNEAVPAALAICAVAPEDPWRACCLAASLGGDCDTVAAIAGAIMGACHGAERFPADAVRALLAANPELRLEALAADLLALRAGAAR
jgi:ADP-ribosylglycohydrolase